MEALPRVSTEHDLPLVLLSGLGQSAADTTPSPGLPAQESGTRIQTSSPICSNEKARPLLEQFLEYDGSGQPWNASALPGPTGKLRYRIKTIGRNYVLPPRKAAPIARPTSHQDNGTNVSGSTELHSPLSPLSPGSPIFPDGLFSPLWFAKHQQHVPALILGFFDISAAARDNDDEQIKADVNAIRASLTRSGYRTKFAAILISDRSLLQAPELEERLASIRRATGLDSKFGLFFLPPVSSSQELSSFVQNIMRTLQSICVDVYRDLSKHARRKKTRVLPGPTATGSPTQALSTSGWNVRYEVKQGVFAEFRQEMDIAERHFSAALDELFSPEGPLEFTPTWSPRWNEARLLADITALRALRCLLWNSSTSAAVHFWSNHRARMKSLVVRRGKGTQTYSWAAWETRWAQTMAQLMVRADLPPFRSPVQSTSDADQSERRQVYTLTEKAVTSLERLQPWFNLHHSGYWLMMAAKSSRSRRAKALEIPEEDRVPPGQSPASAVVSRAETHDFYLVPEPHEESPLSKTSKFDHTAEYVNLTEEATQHFQDTAQYRMTELLNLSTARNLMDVHQNEEAKALLQTLLMKTRWRADGWYDLLLEALNLMHQCAMHLNLYDMIVSTTYELLHEQFTLQSNITRDLTKALDTAQDSSKSSIILKFEDSQRISPFDIQFAFTDKETSVGEPIGCQLSVASCMSRNAAPLSLASITLYLDNSRVVRLIHTPDDEPSLEKMVHLTPNTDSGDGTIEMETNLTFSAKDLRIFTFPLVFKDSSLVRLERIACSIKTEKFSINHEFSEPESLKSDSIYVQTETALVRKYLSDADSTAITVCPKPPKVQILFSGLEKRYYTDETVRISVRILNEENEAVKGRISCRNRDESDALIKLRWAGSVDNSQGPPDSQVEMALPSSLSGSTHEAALIIEAPQDPIRISLEICAKYNLATDDTEIRKAVTLDIDFTEPFESMFDFGPRLFADAWPDYFSSDYKETAELPGGIPQLWDLTTRIRSVAADPFILHGARLQVDEVLGDSQISVRPQADGKKDLKPGEINSFLFQLYTRKYSLDERRPTSVESTVELTWSRDGDSEAVVTRIPTPRLTIPVSEPRVLCTTAQDASGDGLITLSYYIENPSTHFLTFVLTMEASEDFAFSGPKYQALSLAPLSRHAVDYRVVLQDRGDDRDTEGRWIWPVLQVVDSYYQKTLRVLPGGQHVKFDEKQNIGVWIPVA